MSKSKPRSAAAKRAKQEYVPRRRWPSYLPPRPLEETYDLKTRPEARVAGATSPDWEKAVGKARHEESGAKPGEGLSLQEKEWFRQERKGSRESTALEREHARQGKTKKKSMRDKERMIRLIKSLRKKGKE